MSAHAVAADVAAEHQWNPFWNCCCCDLQHVGNGGAVRRRTNRAWSWPEDFEAHLADVMRAAGVGDTEGSPPPTETTEGPSVPQIFLNRNQLEDRCGIARGGAARLALPPEDAITGPVNPDGTPARGATRGWTVATVDAWNATRRKPGRPRAGGDS